MGVIREDVVQIGFDIEESPIASLLSIIDSVRGSVVGATDMGIAGFSNMGNEVQAVSSSVQTATHAVDGLTEAARETQSAASDVRIVTNSVQDLGKASKGAEEGIEKIQKETKKVKSKAFSEMLKDLRQIAATKVGNGLETLKKTPEQATIKINKMKTALSGVKDIKLHSVVKGLDVGLGKALTGAKALLVALPKIAGVSFSGVVKGLKAIAPAAQAAGAAAAGIAKGMAKGVAAAGTAAAGLVTAFLATGEASQEHIEDMGKLGTAYMSAGKTVEQGQQAYRDFVGILGETDQSVEAVNHLAKLTNSQEELSAWTDIAAGVYATFGDSLPLEGLTEAANETAKVGQVTGPLADALNWAGVSEDKFNEKLKKMNSEQERSAFITETLTGLYQESGKTYQEINGDLIAAREAQAGLTDAMAEVGKVAMPITTTFKNIGASILTGILPQVKELGSAFTDMINGDAGAAARFGDVIAEMLMNGVNKAVEFAPMFVTVASSLINSLINGLLQNLPQIANSALQILGMLIQTIQQNLPQLATAAIQVISSLAMFILQAAPQLALTGIQLILSLIQGFIQQIPNLIPAAIQAIQTLVQGFVNMLPSLIQTGIDLIISLAVGLAEATPQLIAMIPEICIQIIQAFSQVNWLQVGWDLISGIGKGLFNGVKNLFNGGKDAGKQAADGVSSGLASNVGTTTTAATSLASSTTAAFSGITNTSQIGASAAANLASGINSNIGAATGAAVNMSSQVEKAAASEVDVKINADTESLNSFKKEVNSLVQTSTQDINKLPKAFNTAFTASANITRTQMALIKTTVSSVKLTESGKDIMRGLNNGMLSMKPVLMSTARSIASSISKTINSELKINSPSKITTETGEFTGAGLVVGMRKMIGKVKETAKGLSGNVVQNVTPYSSSYKPSTSSVSNNSSTQNVTNNYNPQFTLNMNGASANSTTERAVKRWVREGIKETFDSMGRKNPKLQEV